MKRIAVLLVIAALPLAIMSQDLTVFEKNSFTRNGNTLLYRILYPKGYNKSKAYPVLTFLHGSGERGDDNEAQLTHGGALFANDSVRNTFPAIVIFPSAPKTAPGIISDPKEIQRTRPAALSTCLLRLLQLCRHYW